MKDEKESEIKELVTDSILKIKSQVDNNIILLNEMHNTLNWLMTITAILFVYFSQQNEVLATCFLYYVLFFSKTVFVIMIIVFVLYKIVQIRFTKLQIQLYESLATHNLELKYNIKKLMKLFDFDKLSHKDFIFDVIAFIKSFREAKFVFYKNYDTRQVEFHIIDCKLIRLSFIMKFFYWSLLVMFAIYTTGAFVLMFK